MRVRNGTSTGLILGLPANHLNRRGSPSRTDASVLLAHGNGLQEQPVPARADQRGMKPSVRSTQRGKPAVIVMGGFRIL